MGGTLDCSLLCDDGFAPKLLRTYRVSQLQVRIPKFGNFRFGDPTTSYSSYQIVADNVLGWRDVGVVPRGGTALASGGTPGSVGMYFDANCTDSQVVGKSVMMGSQVGFETHGGNVAYVGAHAWSRSSIGWMDYGFDDYVSGTQYVNTYSDTPQYAGYRNRASYGLYLGAVAYNNALYGTDNQAHGFILDNYNNNHVLAFVRIQGADSTHRFATDFNGQTPPHPRYAMRINVASATVDSRPPVSSYTVSTITSLFGADVGRTIEVDSTSAQTVTIAAGRIPTGSEIEIMQVNTGQISVVAGSGVTVQAPGGMNKTRAQFSTIKVRKRAGEVYVLSGDLSA
ncbi:hypothetical protein LX12_004341 [Williamsia serinedens]|uniref:Uncharacterized protein n=1 Tax=Williamsia serinedens TaxID=391736 RepID=A0ABT1H7K4_9NOCA|nr:hypothetical protein [Williamsia serinedens]